MTEAGKPAAPTKAGQPQAPTSETARDDRPTDEPAPPGRRIVVGVDGSACSERALRWAITQAQLTSAGVEAVASWQDPVTSGYYSFGFAPVYTEDEDWPSLTRTSLQDSVAETVRELHPTAPIVTRVVQGHPAQVLLDAARGADLLVVGSRGHGTLTGMLLGSVSQHCVQHSPCPVVVVPADNPVEAARLRPATR